MMPVGIFAGFFLAAVITYMTPKRYESHAVLEIKPPAISSLSGVPNRDLSKFSQTEFVKLKSRNTLLRVVESLDLPRKWAIDQGRALLILEEIVRTENISGTDLYSITVRHTNKEDARDIAAGVAYAYRDYRNELSSNNAERAIMELKKVVREHEDRVDESRKILTIISHNKGLDGGTDPVDAQDYADAKRDFEMAQGLLEQLKLKLIEGEMITWFTESGTVVVHDEPVIGDVPVSPNVSQNLALGAVGGLVVSPFFALPLMWVLGRGKEDERSTRSW